MSATTNVETTVGSASMIQAEDPSILYEEKRQAWTGELATTRGGRTTVE